MTDYLKEQFKRKLKRIMDNLTKKYLEAIRLNKESYWVDLDNKMHITDHLLYEQTSDEIKKLAKILEEKTRKELGYSKEEWRKMGREEQRKCDLWIKNKRMIN